MRDARRSAGRSPAAAGDRSTCAGRSGAAGSALVVLVALAVALAGCAAGDAGRAAAPATAPAPGPVPGGSVPGGSVPGGAVPGGTASAAAAPAGTAAAAPGTVAPAPPELHTGPLEDFYRVPAPLASAPPGTLIRVMPAKSDASSVTVRVMYHSRDAQDHDRAVTGVITYPTAAAPAGGWPVIAWAHGTTGLTSVCAPSRGGGAAPGFGVDGVRVATDYIGLGPLGERHAYLSGRSEAHSVIDAVRAARQLPDAHAGATWVAVGHSQGGHAALFTNELGEAYAPELDLRGTVVVAPAAMLERTFGPNDQIVPRMVGVMALYGWATDYPDVDPNAYVGDDVRARAGVIDQKCLNDVVLSFVAIPAETFYKVPVATEPLASVMRANDPGHVAVPSPLLLVSGTADTFVVPDRVTALHEQLCAAGQVTQLVWLPDATHDSEVRDGADHLRAWLQDRLAGRPAPDDCPPR